MATIDGSEVSLIYELFNAVVAEISVDCIDDDVYYTNLRTSTIDVWNINTNVTRQIAHSLENPRKLFYSSRLNSFLSPYSSDMEVYNYRSMEMP